MRRIRLPIGRIALVAGFFLFALLALLPMRLALDRMGFDRGGLSARAATGSVWNGALEEARIGPVPLGDVRARVNFLPLLLGRARLSLASADPAVGFSGAVTVTRHSRSFDDVTGRLRAGTMFAPLPVTGVDLDGVSASFADGRCLDAGGRVTVMLGGPAVAIGLGRGLIGRAQCAGDAVLIALADQTGTARMNLRLHSDGRYGVDFLVRTVDPATRAQLVAAGFRPAGTGLGMQAGGRF